MVSAIEQNQTKHKWLKSVLIQKINRMSEGQRFTAELELCKEFNLSRMTVNKVITELARDGFLLRKRPLGTFVSNDALKLLKYKNLGLVMPRLGADLTLTESPTNYQIFDGIQKYCMENSWDIQIIQRKNEALSVDRLLHASLAGLIIVMPDNSTYGLISELRHHQVPFLCINLHSEEINRNLNFINMDFYSTTIDAVKYLYGKGKRNIGIIGIHKIREDAHIYSVAKAYRETLKSLKLKETIITSDTEDELPLELIGNFFRANFEKIKKCDALITVLRPYEATVLLKVLKAEKIKVPEEISLLSFFENEESIKAGITSCSPNLREVGYESASLLNEILNDENRNLRQIKKKLNWVPRLTA